MCSEAPLWQFLDVALDIAARNPLWLDIADFFMAGEDFCNQMMVPADTIPAHHKHMFGLRKHGFMAQAKHPYYTSREWLLKHPTPLTGELQTDMSSILYKFEDFLISQDKYHCVLNELYKEWLINRKDFYVVFDANKLPCGRTITWKEADAICEKQPLYQWDIKRNKKYALLPLMTISTM